MNGKQRIHTALNREQPDVVPIWEMAFNEESIIGIGKYFVDDDKLPPKKKTVDMTAEEKKAMMYTYVTFVNELDLDGVTALSTAPRVRIDKDHIRDDYGIVYHQGGEKVGEPYPVDGPVKDMSDLKKYKMRAVKDDDFAMLDLFKSSFPNRSVALHMPATFKLSQSLMGSMEEFLMKYLLEPELAHSLARMVTDYCFDVVEKAVKETIAAAAPGGGYILSSSNSIHPGCKPENYLAMVKAARKYGKYPELAGK